ncbi:MAG: flagellar motor switch protein FliM, partial [Nevskiales bacterium]
EHVVVSRFGIELDGGSGDIHITMPYSMVEPIRDQLDAGVQSDRMDRDEHWTQSLREQIKDAEVELSSNIASSRIPLRRLSQLKAGDILPIDIPKAIDLCVEDIPVFRGRYGVSGGHNAIKITDVIRRPNTRQSNQFKPSSSQN